MVVVAEYLFAKHLNTNELRKQAQKRCASMSREHLKNKDTYKFTDGSRLIIINTRAYLEYGVKQK